MTFTVLSFVDPSPSVVGRADVGHRHDTVDERRLLILGVTGLAPQRRPTTALASLFSLEVSFWSHHLKFLRTIVMLSAVTLSMMTGSAGATTTSLKWTAAETVALPSGGTGIPQGYLPALSCPVARNCSAAGAFSDAAGNTQGLVLDEVNGVWRPSRMLRAPAGAAKNPNVTVNALSCSGAGNCSVVGNYQDKVGNSQSFVANEVRRVWRPAHEVVLASDARATGQNSAVHAVACYSNGNCSAVGT